MLEPEVVSLSRSPLFESGKLGLANEKIPLFFKSVYVQEFHGDFSGKKQKVHAFPSLYYKGL